MNDTDIVAVGIDLAVSHLDTGICILHQDGSNGLSAEFDRLRRKDAGLIDLMSSVPDTATIAVDVPLGWPKGFRAFLSMTNDSETMADYPIPEAEASDYRFQELRLRAADIALRTHLNKIARPYRPQPLSVSTDKLGAATMRWHAIGAQTATPAQRAAFKRVIETYPAAARFLWRWPRKQRYEPEQLGLAPFTMVSWQGAVGPADPADLNDHEWDALVAALVALCGTHQTFPPQESDWVPGEGVIHLQTDDCPSPNPPYS